MLEEQEFLKALELGKNDEAQSKFSGGISQEELMRLAEVELQQERLLQGEAKGTKRNRARKFDRFGQKINRKTDEKRNLDIRVHEPVDSQQMGDWMVPTDTLNSKHY